ncbi:hypothetical protein GCM10012275_28310 [Longimycelium tulufanense]|uniref:Uncharacterized protein n=1 Tax=Longimycelium tulufanense TaxID=907463 RepID=A0A8J3FW01_9PSEU|nr:hypothetical protein GCM10012275_28310 [Longimycelium tulufanense]
MSDVLVAKVSGAFQYEGKSVVIHAGVTTVRAGHPMLKGREYLFQPLRVHHDYDVPRRGVEDASANPGEKRRRGRPPLPRDDNGNIVRAKSESEEP